MDVNKKRFTSVIKPRFSDFDMQGILKTGKTVDLTEEDAGIFVGSRA